MLRQIYGRDSAVLIFLEPNSRPLHCISVECISTKTNKHKDMQRLVYLHTLCLEPLLAISIECTKDKQMDIHVQTNIQRRLVLSLKPLLSILSIECTNTKGQTNGHTHRQRYKWDECTFMPCAFSLFLMSQWTAPAQKDKQMDIQTDRDTKETRVPSCPVLWASSWCLVWSPGRQQSPSASACLPPQRWCHSWLPGSW